MIYIFFTFIISYMRHIHYLDCLASYAMCLEINSPSLSYYHKKTGTAIEDNPARN